MEKTSKVRVIYIGRLAAVCLLFFLVAVWQPKLGNMEKGRRRNFKSTFKNFKSDTRNHLGT